MLPFPFVPIHELHLIVTISQSHDTSGKLNDLGPPSITPTSVWEDITKLHVTFHGIKQRHIAEKAVYLL